MPFPGYDYQVQHVDASDAHWLRRVQQGHYLHLTVHRQLAEVLMPFYSLDGPRGTYGRIALHRYYRCEHEQHRVTTEVWYTTTDGRGNDGSQILQPIVGQLPRAEPMFIHARMGVDLAAEELAAAQGGSALLSELSEETLADMRRWAQAQTDRQTFEALAMADVSPHRDVAGVLQSAERAYQAQAATRASLQHAIELVSQEIAADEARRSRPRTRRIEIPDFLQENPS